MDLLAGELSPGEERSLRAAIEDCADCGAEFEMMALLMDLSGPPLRASAPKSMDAAIMAAAKAHVAGANGKEAEAQEAKEPSPGIWTRLGKWLESIAIGPQFAMASVMVLVVAVGFWYVPKHQSHEVAGSTVVLSDPEGEAVAADDPARALLGAGERVQDLAAPTPTQRDPAEQTPTPEPPSVEEQVAPETSPASNPPSNIRPNMRAPAVQERAPVAQTVQTRTDMAMTRGATRMTIPPERMIENRGDDDVENLQQQSAAWAQELEGLPMPTYNDEIPSAPSAPASGQAQAPRPAGSALATEGQAPQVDEGPARASSPARALLQLARSHRSEARCAEAVRHYESLLARFASSPEVPQALMESADCYRRLGRISDAERALRRALQFASTRTNARRELTRLETIRAAQRESSAPSSQDSFESEY